MARCVRSTTRRACAFAADNACTHLLSEESLLSSTKAGSTSFQQDADSCKRSHAPPAREHHHLTQHRQHFFGKGLWVCTAPLCSCYARADVGILELHSYLIILKHVCADSSTVQSHLRSMVLRRAVSSTCICSTGAHAAAAWGRTQGAPTGTGSCKSLAAAGRCQGRGDAAAAEPQG